VAFTPFRPKTHGNIYKDSLWMFIGLLNLAQDQGWEAKGGLALTAELLRDDLHDNAHKTYGTDGARVDYLVRLELAHALLNLTHAQMALKQ
jgi:hypothetical protein